MANLKKLNVMALQDIVGVLMRMEKGFKVLCLLKRTLTVRKVLFLCYIFVHYDFSGSKVMSLMTVAKLKSVTTYPRTFRGKIVPSSAKIKEKIGILGTIM